MDESDTMSISASESSTTVAGTLFLDNPDVDTDIDEFEGDGDGASQIFRRPCSLSGPLSSASNSSTPLMAAVNRQSWVFKFFFELSRPSVLDQKGMYKRWRCLKCTNDFSSSSGTSTLSKHLRLAHGIREPPKPQPINESKSFNRTIDSYSTTPHGSARQIRFQHEVVRFIAMEHMPVRIVESEHFRRFVDFLDNRYQHIGDEKAKEIIGNCSSRAKENILEELTAALSVCITCDTWTSISNDPFWGVTAHHITADFQKRNYLLTFEPAPYPHTMDNLRIQLHSILSKYSIVNKVFAVTSDGAIKSLFDMPDEIMIVDQIGEHWIWCQGHVLNLVSQKALKHESVRSDVDKIRNLVHFFRRPKAKQFLHDSQVQMGSSRVLECILDVPTRWNSTLYMIERILRLDAAISIVAGLMKKAVSDGDETVKALFTTFQSLILSADQQKIMNELVQLLQPLEAATRWFSGEEYVTISLIYPVLHMTKTTLANLRNGLQTDCAKCLCDLLLLEFEERVPPEKITLLQCICCLLDPRFKNLELPQTAAAIAFFKNHLEVDHQPNISGADSTRHEGPLVATEPVYLQVFENFASNTAFNRPHRSELDRYLDDTADFRIDPLQWWRDRRQTFPRLYRMAMVCTCMYH